MRRPKLKLDHLISILTLAEKRDFNRAAKELGLTPSALRKQIEVAEDAVGGRLFQSTKDGPALTEDGEVIRAPAAKAIEYVLLAEDQVRTHQLLRARRLLIGHSTYLAPKVIALVNQLSIEDPPGVHIEHESGQTSSIIHRVVGGEFHAGFGLLPIVHPDLIVRLIYEEPLVVCIPGDHKLAPKPVIRPEDLNAEPIIAVGRQSLPALHEEIDDHFKGFGIDLAVTTDVLSPVEALACVSHRVGICLLSGTAAIARPGVIVRPLSTHVLTRKSGIFVRKDNDAPLIQKLIEVVLQRSAALRPQSK